MVETETLPAELEPWSLLTTAVSPGEATFMASRQKILVVDDTPVNLKVIRAHLAADGYDKIEIVDDSREAIAALSRYQPDLLLLDLMMPHVSGLDILRTIRGIPQFRRLPVIIITAVEEREIKTKCLALGATDFLAKPVQPEDLLLRVRNTLELKYYQDSLEQKVLERTSELMRSREEVVHCLARAAEYRDNETGNHVIRVGRYASLVARRLGFDASTCHMIELASTLHDMGKVGIPDAILNKPGALTDDERTLMQEHCRFGAEICKPARADAPAGAFMHVVIGAMMLNKSVSPLLQMASNIALTHHERWDGGGYPRGLSGEAIPIEGRITAVADVFDALSSKRPYKPAFPLDKCFALIEEGAGKHFDPKVVEVFLADKSEVLAIHDACRDV